MKSKNFFYVFCLCLTILTLVPTNKVLADSDDLLSGANTASLGDNVGEITVYQEKDYFNFSADPNKIYNFTLDITNGDNNLLDYYLYSPNGTQLAYEWNTINQNVTYSATGLSLYTILVQGDFEFTVLNASYNVIIKDVTPGSTTSSSSTSSTSTLSDQNGQTTSKIESTTSDNNQTTSLALDSPILLFSFVLITIIVRKSKQINFK